MIKNEVFARANEGDAKSQALVAYEYYKEQNFAGAVRWANASALQGNDEGLYLLGIFYWNGSGVDKDLDRAVGYLRRSAQLGYIEAQKILDKYNIPIQEPLPQVQAPSVQFQQPTAKRGKKDGIATPAPESIVGKVAESAARVSAEPEISNAQRIKRYQESLDQAPEERKKVLKQKAREERERAKRRKKRRRMAKMKKVNKAIGIIILIIVLLVVVVAGTVAGLIFVPKTGVRGALNSFTIAMLNNDIVATKEAMYFPTDTASSAFDTLYGETYLTTYDNVIPVMLSETISEDGLTAKAKVFLFCQYSSAGDGSNKQTVFTMVTINLSKDGETWKIDVPENRDEPLAAIADSYGSEAAPEATE